MIKFAPRILFLFALLLLPAAAAAQQSPLEVVTPEAAYVSFVEQLRDALGHLGKGEQALAREALQGAVASKWDGGLGDLPAHAGLLLVQAEKTYQNGNPEFAEEVAQFAQRLSPESVETRLCLARYHLGGGPISPATALGDLAGAARLLGGDALALYRALGRLFALPALLIFIFGAGFGLVMAGRYLVLLMHDLKDLFPVGDLPWWMSLSLALAVLLLPLVAGLSLWWLFAWWFICLFIYMKWSERLAVYIWFVLLLLSPLYVKYYSIVAANRQDPALMAVIRARTGIPQPGDVPVLEEILTKNPDDILARVALADLLRRQGRFNSAYEIYTPALKEAESEQLAYNNIAEMFYAVGDLKSTLNALLSAQKAGPEQVEIHHNLGQYYQANGEMAKMGDEYKKAAEVDASQADELKQRVEGFTEGGHVNRLNRVMASIQIPFSMVWERSLRGSAVARLVEAGVWRQWFGAPAGLAFQGAAACGLLGLILLQLMGRNWRVARRCNSCGLPICTRCHRQAKDPAICSPCYNVFKGDGGIDLKVKMQKRSEVQRRHDLWSRIALGLALVFPGAGQLLLGFTGSGIALFSLAGLVAAGAASRLVLWPAPAPAYSGGLALPAAALILAYLVLMIVSLLVMRTKIDTWR